MNPIPNLQDPRHGWRGFLPLLAIVAAIFLAWANSFSAPFELDDDASIAGNPTIRDLSSFHWLKPPAARGETVSGRPTLNLTFAVDYAVGGLDVRWYHATNFAIHLAAALALWGLSRRALRWPGLPPEIRDFSDGLALAIALIWAVHPLQTQAVTYIVQRAESLMSLCYLLTIYGYVRACSEEAEPRLTSRRTRNGWLAFSWIACAVGMATKENMVSAPFAVLLFDRAFVAGGFIAALRKRWRYYTAIAATWVLLLALVLSTGGNRGGSVGFDVGVSWPSYVATQFVALARYGALSVWPFPLVFEYGDFFVTSSEIIGAILIVGVALGGTIYALLRHPRVGFVLAVGWMVLAPTSLVPGTLQMIVEHRMYLPLASIVVVGCLGVARLIGPSRRLGRAIGILLAAGLCALTSSRNTVYRSSLALWQDTVAKRPENPRAHNNLGLAWLEAGSVDRAIAEFLRTIALQPNHAFAHANLGNVYLRQQRWSDAAEQFSAALTADPHLANAHFNLAVALSQLRRGQEAVAHYRAAIADDPMSDDAPVSLAALLIDENQTAEAEQQLRRVVARNPNVAFVHYQLGRLAERRGKTDEAMREYQSAVRLNTSLGEPHLAMGNLLLARGDLAGAQREYDEAMRLSPGAADPHFAVANLFAAHEQFDRAAAEYQRALALDPNHLEARANLANCQLVTGDVIHAIQNYEIVLQRRPADQRVRKNLEIARELAAGRTP